MLRVLLTGLLCAAAVRANYFSEGWRPGKPTAKAVPSATTVFEASHATPTSTASTGKPKSFWEGIFTTGPIGALMQRAGVNVSAAIERASKNDQWDERIPLIDDYNFADMITNETMTASEEAERVWFLVVSGGSGKQNNALSLHVDKYFDEAYNITLEAGDLPNVRWGRVNYLDVTYITTRWSIWRPPVIVVLTNRGRNLRFYYPQTLVIRGQALHDFLAKEAWKEQQPWSSPWAPGGDREWLMEYFSIALAAVMNFLARVPQIFLLLFTGAMTSVIISCLHRNDKKEEGKPRTPPSKNPAVLRLANANIDEPEPEPESKKNKKRKGGRGM